MIGFAASAADYYLIGGFNGWSLMDQSCKFTDNGDGTYVLDYQGTLTSDFKLNDGTWENDKANWGSNGKTLVIGEEYQLNCSGSSGNIKLSSNIDTPHIVFNPTASTLLITGQSVAAETKYGIHGQIFTGEWQTIDMEAQSDGTWKLSSTVIPGEFGIKAMDKASGMQTGWYSADGSSAVGTEQFGTALKAKLDGTNWTSTISGEVTFTFDPEAPALVITGEGSDVHPGTPSALYLIGNLASGQWDTTAAPAFAQDGDIFTLEEVQIVAPESLEYGYFTLLTAIGATWDEVNKSDRYGALTADEVISAGDSAPITHFAAPASSGSANSWCVAPGTYKITVDFTTMMLTIEATVSGVEDITIDSATETVYYNLQGIRVDRPTKGIYIVNGRKIVK